LVISYYWPPAGGISVLRSLKIVKYLRQFGWEPVVHIPENADYPVIDQGGFKDIPEGIEILQQKVLEPFKLFKLITGRKQEDSLNSIVQVKTKKNNLLDDVGIWIRGNFFIPDARSLWVKPSVKSLSKYLKEHKVDAIFSDGPPHTNNRIAYHISKKFDIPWLADFQDPWTQADYYQMMKITNWGHQIHRKMEQEVFQQASKITIASPSWKQDLEAIGARNVDVIYYGYDEDDFKELKSRNNKDTFDIVHIGLLGTDRYPDKLMPILSEIVSEKPIRILLAGQVDIEVQQKLNSDTQNNIIIENLGFIQRKDALQLAFDADLLLLPLNKAENAKGRLPGKLYEYLRTYNPILALGISNGDAAEIVRKCNCGDCFEYENRHSIKDFISGLYNTTKEITPLKKEIAQFSNENQTMKIADYLNKIVNGNG
jgi:hypothetical protein